MAMQKASVNELPKGHKSDQTNRRKILSFLATIKAMPILLQLKCSDLHTMHAKQSKYYLCFRTFNSFCGSSQDWQFTITLKLNLRKN